MMTVGVDGQPLKAPTASGMGDQVLSRWRDDHLSIRRLLSFLTEQIEKVRVGEDEVELELVREVFLYLTDYIDRIHHPVEDAVARRLERAESSEMRNSSWHLLDQHKQIAEDGAALLSQIDKAAQDAPVLRRDIADCWEAYSRGLLRHMNAEEEYLLPLSARCLTELDWKKVWDEAPRAEDPIFGPSVQPSYVEISRELARREGHQRP
jgi:hemerythrin-like domain-containing protein